MTYRKTIFANNFVYHVYNKTIDHKILFNQPILNKLFINLLWYYRQAIPKQRYSYFKKLEFKKRKNLMPYINDNDQFKTEVLAYVLMPNHFHLLLKQKKTNGIVRYLSDIINAFTRAFNSYHKRQGPLFLPNFKAKMIRTEEQLMHTSRYIHLNPYSSQLIKKPEDLIDYEFSSLKEYLEKPNICQTRDILELFSNSKNYYEFILNNAEYQKTLEHIKHNTPEVLLW